MVRPRTNVGRSGVIRAVRVLDSRGDKRWQAECRHRGEDGVSRRIKRYAPADDNTEEAARQALREAIDEIGGNSDITKDTPVADLLDVHMQTVRTSPELYARRTVDSYTRIANVLRPRLGELRAREITVARLKAIVKGIEKDHGRVTATQSKTLLTAVGVLLVDSEVWRFNMAEQARLPRSRRVVKSARGLTESEVRQIIDGLNNSQAPLPPVRGAIKSTTTRTVSQFATNVDLTDIITVLAYLGLRRSEVLGLVWSDYSRKDGTLTIQHHVIRAGRDDGTTELIHEAVGKTAESYRVIQLPEGVVRLLDRRRKELRPVSAGLPPLVFPNTAGQLRDPDTFAEQWRRVRGPLGFDWVATHTFRKTAATLMDSAGLSARQIADVLGHKNISMTTDVYMGRNNLHPEAAVAMDKVLGTA